MIRFSLAPSLSSPALRGRIWVGAFLLVLAACGHDGSAATLNAPVQLAPGQTAVFKDEQLKVQLVSVADSRCPTDVTCLWAGEALVRLAIHSRGKGFEQELKELQKSPLDGYVFEILEVLPARGPEAQRIAPADYRVTLKVIRESH
jgi:hypothetical protein